MLFYDDDKNKSAITNGSGIWRWKLQEAGANEKSPLFDEIVLKTIQLLSVKSDKKQFVFKPRQSILGENDRVFLDVEFYNEIYDRVYGNRIKLDLTDESGKTTNHELVDSKSNASFNLGRLRAGLYKYQAVTNYANKNFIEKGEFLVKKTQLEALNLQADHQMLRAIAKRSRGGYFTFSDRNMLSSL